MRSRNVCAFEPLEDRRLLSVTVNSISVNPNPMVRSAKATLTADVSASADDRVRSVMYFVDDNSNGVRDRGEFVIGQSGNARNAFAVNKRVPPDANLGALNITAIAKGIHGRTDVSPGLTESFTVADSAPTIRQLVAAPKNVRIGRTFKLIATGVKNTDGDRRIAQVEFWLDVNNDGQIDAGDQSLGVDTSAAGGWKVTGDTTGVSPGIYSFLAQAIDTDGSVSNVVATTATAIA